MEWSGVHGMSVDIVRNAPLDILFMSDISFNARIVEFPINQLTIITWQHMTSCGIAVVSANYCVDKQVRTFFPICCHTINPQFLFIEDNGIKDHYKGCNLYLKAKFYHFVLFPKLGLHFACWILVHVFCRPILDLWKSSMTKIGTLARISLLSYFT